MDKRTEYVEKLSAQMVDWDVQIEQLKDKAESAPPETKFDYAKLIAALRSMPGVCAVLASFALLISPSILYHARARDEFGGPEEVARWLRRARPRGMLYVVPDSPHLFPGRAREAARRVVEAADGILDRVPPGGAA